MARTIYRPGKNPAKELYRFWLTVLEFMHPAGLEINKLVTLDGTGSQWGIRVDGHDERGRPIISLGRHYGYGHQSSFMWLDARGHFRLHWMWGYERRNGVQRNTFLRYGSLHSKYSWFVADNPTEPTGGYYGVSLRDWENPHDYLGEDVIGAVGWRQHGIWMKLQPGVRDLWTIVPVVADSSYDRFVQLREKRYRRFERAARRRRGEDVPKRSEPAGRVTHEGQVLTHQEAVEQMVAFLDVRMPARTITPLHRGPVRPQSEEEHVGDNLVTTNDA